MGWGRVVFRGEALLPSPVPKSEGSGGTRHSQEVLGWVIAAFCKPG